VSFSNLGALCTSELILGFFFFCNKTKEAQIHCYPAEELSHVSSGFCSEKVERLNRYLISLGHGAL
jgi:hypothetical protein